MRLLVSCADSGSLKEVICESGTDTSKQTAKQPLHIGTFLSEGLKNAIEQLEVVTENFLLLARSNGSLELVETERKLKEELTEQEQADSKQSKSVTEVEPKIEISSFERVHQLEQLADDSRLEPLYAASKRRVRLRDGFVSLQHLPNSKYTYLAATKSGLLHIVKIDLQKKEIKKLNTLEVKAPLEFVQLNDIEGNDHNGKHVFAYGGEENLVKLATFEPDFSKLTQIWEAKNVKNDRLDMKVPVWPMKLKFIEPFSSEEHEDNKLNFQFVVITRWSHLGLYRTQHGRKPFKYIDLLPNREPLTQLELIGNKYTPLGNLEIENFEGLSLITADTKNNVYKFGVDGRVLCKFGQGDLTGAPTFISVHDNKYLLQGGLDRYVRVYDLSSGDRLAKVYLNSRINSLKLVDMVAETSTMKTVAQSKVSKKRELVSAEDDEDADELWKQLDSKHAKIRKI